MKLISWNCNGAFRNKYQALNYFNADVWVIPESESPATLHKQNSPLQTANHLWTGNNQTRGLSVFAFNGYQIRLADFFNSDYQYILPVWVTPPKLPEFLLIAVWTSRIKNNPDWDYIGQLCHFMENYRQVIPPQTIMMGDFNINMQWNKSYKKNHNYSHFLELCAQQDFISLYHELSGQAQGQEETPTIYFHRDPQRGYHIDYVYLHKQQLPNVKNFKIHGCEWLPLSDHTVLELDLLPPIK